MDGDGEHTTPPRPRQSMRTTTKSVPERQSLSHRTTTSTSAGHDRSGFGSRSRKPPLSPVIHGVIDHPLYDHPLYDASLDYTSNGNSLASKTSQPSSPLTSTAAGHRGGNSESSSSAYAAALVQSAAKSVLDTSTTTVSDDEFDDNDEEDDNDSFRGHVHHTKSRSLPTSPLVEQHQQQHQQQQRRRRQQTNNGSSDDFIVNNVPTQDDPDTCHDDHATQHEKDEDVLRLLSSPTLQSLQTKTLPALPNKHDRKRFIGCIAAILSSAYDYDCGYYNKIDNENKDEDSSNNTNNILNENDADNIADSFAYLDDDIEFVDDIVDYKKYSGILTGKDEEANLHNFASDEQQPQPLPPQPLPPQQPQPQPQPPQQDLLCGSVTNTDGDVNEQQYHEKEEESETNEHSHPSGRRRRVQGNIFTKKNLIRTLSRSESSFDYDEVSEDNFPQPQSLEIGATTKTNIHVAGEGRRLSLLSPPPPPPPQHQQYPVQQRQTSTTTFSSSTRMNATSGNRPNRPTPSQPPPPSSRRGNRRHDAAMLARNRHRIRRYELLSNFLLSSADYFEMDRMHAKAFLPMMTRLLAPQPTVPSTTGNSGPKESSSNMSPPQSKGDGDGSSRRGSGDESETTDYATQQQQSENSLDSFDPSLQQPGYCDDFKTDSPPASDISISFSNTVEDNSSPCNDIPNPSSSTSRTNTTGTCFIREMDQDESLSPFLESLTPGSGFRCLSLLLLQHLLHSNQGYDARIRHVIKKIGVIVLVNEMKRDPYGYLPDQDDDDEKNNHNKSSNHNHGQSQDRSKKSSDSKSNVGGSSSTIEASGMSSNDAMLVEIATRKFESLEHAIAWKLLHQLSETPRRPGRGYDNAGDAPKTGVQKRRAQIVRGLKIGSAGLVAGTLFAVTGGLAAPGIAAGVAAIAGSTAATAAVVTLTSTAAVTAIFGVGGGGLAAYKMHRRTNGLTEFAFQKESGVAINPRTGRRVQSKEVEAELFSTICLSGWLRDQHDFQRPWGCEPTNPRLIDRLEQLERFYAVYKPEYVTKCAKILAKWRGEERQLWAYLRQTYGRDPSNLFPVEDGPRRRHGLTHEQDEVLDKMFAELGFISAHEGDNTNNSCNPSNSAPQEGGSRRNTGWKQRFGDRRQPHAPYADVSSGQSGPNSRMVRADSIPVAPEMVSTASSGADSMYTSSTSTSKPNDSFQGKENDKEKGKAPPKHISTVWDYQSIYGGELYTVKWESNLLLELSDSVDDMALDMVGGATAQILKQTALSTLMSAIALPYALVSAANMIDGTWTLMIERAEEAGKELAKSLLFSRAGHRPVTLVGYSMGARVIYKCLKELARHQEIWEDIQSRKHATDSSGTNNGGSPQQPPRRKPRGAPNEEENYEKMREPAGIVEDAILMGMPNHLSLSSWVACRQVVAGRLVNCFSRKDYILSLMFQFKRLMLRPVCGTCPVEVHGVENIDVTDLITGHKDYCLAVGDILKRVRHGQPLRNPGQSEVIVTG